MLLPIPKIPTTWSLRRDDHTIRLRKCVFLRQCRIGHHFMLLPPKAEHFELQAFYLTSGRFYLTAFSLILFDSIRPFSFFSLFLHLHGAGGSPYHQSSSPLTTRWCWNRPYSVPSAASVFPSLRCMDLSMPCRMCLQETASYKRERGLFSMALLRGFLLPTRFSHSC